MWLLKKPAVCCNLIQNSSYTPTKMSDALSMLAQDLSQDDCEIKVQAVRRIGAVAALLGPEATRKDLLPLLSSACVHTPRLPHYFPYSTAYKSQPSIFYPLLSLSNHSPHSTTLFYFFLHH